MISEQRARAYRQVRRLGYPARTAAWLTSAPRYDVPGTSEAARPEYDPHGWRAQYLDPRIVRPWSGFDLPAAEVGGSTYLVGYVPDDEIDHWADMEPELVPPPDVRDSISFYGVVVVRVSDGEERALWGIDCDDRLPAGADDRYLREVACDLTDEIAAVPVLNPGRLLLPLGVTA